MEFYYDLDGTPITREQWSEMYAVREHSRSAAPDGQSTPANDPTRIGSDHVGNAWVSTVWVGIDMGYRNDPPVIFETMIFGGEHDQFCERYCTKESALAGHDRIVTALREGCEP